MPEAKTTNPHLVSQIVRSFVAHNHIAAGDLPNLIATVHRSLSELGPPVEALPLKSAVAINRSYGPNFVVCLDCGWRGQMLRRHLMVAHGLSPIDYRARWHLKPTHPITAPGYSAHRSTLAKGVGLGRIGKGRAPAAASIQPSAPTLSDLDPTLVASLSASKTRRRSPRSRTPAHPAPSAS